MSDDIFSDLETTKQNPIYEQLANGLKILIESVISEKNTDISKRELKAISILKQNPYIWHIIQDYVPNKRYVKAKFGNDLKEIIKDISLAMAQINTESENEGRFSKFFNRFR